MGMKTPFITTFHLPHPHQDAPSEGQRAINSELWQETDTNIDARAYGENSSCL